ncbi:Hypothetical protein F387_01527 [Wohlfahrtiimonas chitiniclastica SH04]|uniref:HTH tetR-type domain-containing protein n=1 Tax=Wohlfahrtiimonas chitiniclastica SH04 TaxID=1261130 RepID=L8XZJ1_9GAMM|nr:TetR/AcrR family transcriptional regulator [Wohlfahrtiimonas chitiniclastica]ELV07721.1 Hypothetical protein F387_01527 [Wohlfahrtiimonas chitiniclastica SH04]
MTAAKLQEVALMRFATQGFEGTSMNELAEDVGIKKSSIYAHFSSKDELFLSLLPILIESELDYVQAVMTQNNAIKPALYAYLESISTRFESSYHVRFWLRNLYAPPVHLRDEVIGHMQCFMDELEVIIHAAIESSTWHTNASVSTALITANYMAMVDGLQTELLFGGVERYQKRLAATWQWFELALRT